MSKKNIVVLLLLLIPAHAVKGNCSEILTALRTSKTMVFDKEQRAMREQEFRATFRMNNGDEEVGCDPEEMEEFVDQLFETREGVRYEAKRGNVDKTRIVLPPPLPEWNYELRKMLASYFVIDRSLVCRTPEERKEYLIIGTAYQRMVQDYDRKVFERQQDAWKLGKEVKSREDVRDEIREKRIESHGRVTALGINLGDAVDMLLAGEALTTECRTSSRPTGDGRAAVKLVRKSCVDSVADLETLYLDSEVMPPLRILALAIVSLDEEEGRELFDKVITEDDWIYRSSAAEALSFIHGSDATELITQVLYDEDWRVRLSAYKALSRRPLEESRDAVLEMLMTDEYFVRVGALEIFHDALEREPSPLEGDYEEFFDVLGELAEDESEYLSFNARSVIDTLEEKVGIQEYRSTGSP